MKFVAGFVIAIALIIIAAAVVTMTGTYNVAATAPENGLERMVLGPGKEFALIVPPGINVAVPAGWSALAIERVRVDVS